MTNSKITALNPANAVKTGPKPPSHLKTAGKKLWRYGAETFELEEHDFVVLTAFAETVDRKTQAEKELREYVQKNSSLTFVNRHGELKPHPLIGVIRDCNISIARLRRELAFSEDDPHKPRPPKLPYGG
jgi:phage terminase small subunit